MLTLPGTAQLSLTVHLTEHLTVWLTTSLCTRHLHSYPWLMLLDASARPGRGFQRSIVIAQVPELLGLAGPGYGILIEGDILCGMFLQVVCFCSTVDGRIGGQDVSIEVGEEEGVSLRLRHVGFERAASISTSKRLLGAM